MRTRFGQIKNLIIPASKFFQPGTVALCLLSTTAVAADLLGTQVSGDFDSGGINLFDPANGYVPAGYGNSIGPTATVNSGVITFGVSFAGVFTDTATFTGTMLTLSEEGPPGAIAQPMTGWTMTFTDPALGGISKISDDFPDGGVSVSFSGHTITLQEAGFVVLSARGEATATFGIDVVPEPSTTALGLSGALAFLFCRRK